MTGNEGNDDAEASNINLASLIGLGVAFGLLGGVLVGVLIDNIGLGIGLGMPLGAALGAVRFSSKGDESTDD